MKFHVRNNYRGDISYHENAITGEKWVYTDDDAESLRKRLLEEEIEAVKARIKSLEIIPIEEEE